LSPGGLWCGESTGGTAGAADANTNAVVQTGLGPTISGPGGKVNLGAPGYVPATPDYTKPSLNDITMWVEDQVANGTLVPPPGTSVAAFIDSQVAQLMQGNPNTDNARYYATANPNSYGYHAFWGVGY
jgi:hypothetical protein